MKQGWPQRPLETHPVHRVFPLKLNSSRLRRVFLVLGHLCDFCEQSSEKLSDIESFHFSTVLFGFPRDGVMKH